MFRADADPRGRTAAAGTRGALSCYRDYGSQLLANSDAVLGADRLAPVLANLRGRAPRATPLAVDSRECRPLLGM